MLENESEDLHLLEGSENTMYCCQTRIQNRSFLVAGQGLMNGRLEAPDMFYWCALTISRFQILVQYSNDLIIQDLELADSFNHFLQRLKKIKIVASDWHFYTMLNFSDSQKETQGCPHTTFFMTSSLPSCFWTFNKW